MRIMLFCFFCRPACDRSLTLAATVQTNVYTETPQRDCKVLTSFTSDSLICVADDNNERKRILPGRRKSALETVAVRRKNARAREAWKPRIAALKPEIIPVVDATRSRAHGVCRPLGSNRAAGIAEQSPAERKPAYAAKIW